MTPKIQTAHGYALPPAPRHSITVHCPGWEIATKIRDIHLHPGLLNEMHSMYPRIKIHQDIQELSGKILGKVGQDPANPKACMLFASRETADECKAYATDPSRGEAMLKPEDISIRVFDIKSRYFAVIVPAVKFGSIIRFWINPGMGISSRMGEEGLNHIELLHEVTDDSPAPQAEVSPAQLKIRERIAGLLERAPVGPARSKKVQPDDVYLFPTGMAVIYSLHKYLLMKQNKSSVLFGFAFHSTIHILEDFGPGCKFFGNADEKDLADLEEYLEAEAKEGRSIQALYTEFPANPLLRSPDLTKLRELADKYHFVLVVDDTVGSFCNVDVLGVADIVITSLTKTFSGYADVIAGSATLNPSSPLYASLKPLFQQNYVNYFFNADAETLEENSRDYLSRSKILNNNALRLVEYLQTKVQDPKSSVAKIHYPTVQPSLSHYQKYMRPATDEFTPGYGCLLSIEFNSVAAAAAFVDNLNVHQGPHLGAHLTLAMPYAMAMYGHDKLDWVAPFGLTESQIRVSVGLEETEALLEDFKEGLEFADRAKA